MTIFFSTNIICDICDKYELWRQTESDTGYTLCITHYTGCPHDLWEQSGLGNQTRHWTAFVIPDNLHWEQTHTFTWFYDKAQNFLIGCWMNFSFVQNFKIIEMRDFFLKPSFCPCLNHIDSTDGHFFWNDGMVLPTLVHHHWMFFFSQVGYCFKWFSKT